MARTIEELINQFTGNENSGCAAVLTKDVINETELLASNGYNRVYRHPAEKNTALFVMGYSFDGLEFAIYINEYLTSKATGEVINLPEELVKIDWRPNWSSYDGLKRFQSIKEINGHRYTLEEVIISLYLYGDIRPLRVKGMQIHHESFVFDARIEYLYLVSKAVHDQIHKIETRAAHNRVIVVKSGVRYVFEHKNIKRIDENELRTLLKQYSLV